MIIQSDYGTQKTQLEMQSLENIRVSYTQFAFQETNHLLYLEVMIKQSDYGTYTIHLKTLSLGNTKMTYIQCTFQEAKD